MYGNAARVYLPSLLARYVDYRVAGSGWSIHSNTVFVRTAREYSKRCTSCIDTPNLLLLFPHQLNYLHHREPGFNSSTIPVDKSSFSSAHHGGRRLLCSESISFL